MIQVSECNDSWRQAWDNVLPNKIRLADWLQALSVVAEIVGATVEITCAITLLDSTLVNSCPGARVAGIATLWDGCALPRAFKAPTMVCTLQFFVVCDSALRQRYQPMWADIKESLPCVTTISPNAPAGRKSTLIRRSDLQASEMTQQTFQIVCLIKFTAIHKCG